MTTDGRPTVLVIGGAFPRRGRANLGDVAQAAEIVRQLRERLPGASVRLLANALDEDGVAGTPVDRSQIGYLRSPAGRRLASSLPDRLLAFVRSANLVRNARRVARGRPPRHLSRPGRDALDVLCDADALVVAGSGGFTDLYLGGVVSVWVTLLAAMRALGRPVVLSGQQIGPLRRPWNRAVVRWALRSAEVVGVREPRSIREGAALGIEPDRLVLTGDDAWSLPLPEDGTVDGLLHDRGVTGGFVAVQVRADQSTGWSPRDLRRLAAALDHVASATSLPVVFVSMVTTPDGTGDRADNARVAEHLSTPSVVLDERLDAATTKAVLGRATVAVGVSNHFLVFAASAGTPAIGLHRSPYLAHKVCGLAELHPKLVRALDWGDEAARRSLPAAVTELLGRRSAASRPSVDHLRPTAAVDALPALLGIGATEVARGG